MELDEVKQIIELMDANNLSEFELEREGVRIMIKKGIQAPIVQTVQTVPQPVAAAVESKPASPAPVAGAGDESHCVEIKAPFVGTFYRAPSPESEPFVTEGQEVNPDTVLCILEAMKVMNEIKAEMRGTVRAILVDNAHAVQLGQPLFRIEKI